MMGVQGQCDGEQDNEGPRDTDAMKSPTRVHQLSIPHSTEMPWSSAMARRPHFQSSRWARAHQIKDLLYHLNSVRKHILVRHVSLNCYHRCRHQHIDIAFTPSRSTSIPSLLPVPARSLHHVGCSLLQFSIIFLNGQHPRRGPRAAGCLR